MLRLRPIGRSFLIFSVVLVATPVGAAFLVVPGELDDRVLRNNGSRSDVPVGRVGAATTGGTDVRGSRAAVFVFKLPASGAGGRPPVIAADLGFTIVSDPMTGAYNIDLYGLGNRADPPVVGTDNYVGPLDTSDATLLQNNLIPQGRTSPMTGPTTLAEAGRVALVDYLNAQYGPDGAGSGRYVFLRLNPDVVPPLEDSGIDVAFAENPTGQPTMTIAFAPEPAVATGMVTAWLMLGLTRRRRRRGGVRR